MGSNLIIVVFAVVVVGGMGSILGSIVTGLSLGLVEGLTKVFYPQFVMLALCFGLFACAFNLLIGFGGLLSFGHAMFLGMASYFAAYLAKSGVNLETVTIFSHPFTLGWHMAPLSPALAIVVAVAGTALLGYVAGLLAIKRQGIYFAMITLALAQMVFFFCLQAPFTGGEDGIQAVPRGKLFGVWDLKNDMLMYYVVMAVFAAGVLLIYRIIHSPFGQVLKAIRENEPRAISIGYRTERYKLAAFVLSAALAGLAGATKAIAFQNASLTDVQWQMSGEVVLMTLLGGMGTVFGPVVGAFVIVAMQFYLSDLGSWVTIVQGIIFVVCVLAFRRGIVGEIEAWLRARRGP
ncbi:MAG TPA: branched-chain amino acid ABC transporter permease [Usitatibacter sp.]|nr:branched-chain amino acid ABC transporter permease [Usitatibacter sp.]